MRVRLEFVRWLVGRPWDGRLQSLTGPERELLFKTQAGYHQAVAWAKQWTPEQGPDPVPVDELIDSLRQTWASADAPGPKRMVQGRTGQSGGLSEHSVVRERTGLLNKCSGQRAGGGNSRTEQT